MAKQLNVNLAFTADTSQAKAQLQSLQTQLSGLLNSTNGQSFGNQITGDINKASKAIAELKLHLKNATNVNTGNLDFTKLNESLNKSGTTLQQYGDKLRSLGPAGQQAFNTLASSIAQSEIPIRRSNAALTELWTTLKNTVRWQISSSVLHGFMSTISGAVGYAKDLNKSLNDIRIVTGASVDEMARFAEQANRSAKALSASTTAYTKASLIYYQQGLDDQAVKERTDVTIKMANVSSQSAETVSDQMTAVWNNFAKGGENLERFADVMVRLGADTASSSDEIAQGLEKFAAIGDMVGLSFDNAAAALATVTATTRQSADVVGTAFKTIFARIQGLKLGETLEDGTDLNKYSKALAAAGISIKEQNGELKDMDNILAEMGAKWKTLSKDQQVALAQTVAGLRQYNQLVALMENFDFYEQNLQSAKNAEGSLQEQADIYAESWQAASDRVKAAIQGIYEDLLNDEAFIDVLNIIEKILTYVDNLIDGLGGLGGVLTTIGALLTRAFSSQIAQGITSMTNSIKMMTAAGREQAQQQKAQFMKDSAEAMRGMSDGSNEGNMRATMMEDQLRLQTSMIENSERMSAEEQQINQMLLDRQRILSDNAIAAAKELDAATEARSDATFNARVELAQEARGWAGGDLEVQKKNLSEFTKQFNQVQQKLKQGITARANLEELRKLPVEGEKGKQVIDKIKQAVDKIDDTEIKEIVNSLDTMELNAENVEDAIAALTIRLREMQSTSEANMMDENNEWMLSEDAVHGLSTAYEDEAMAALRTKDAEEQANEARDNAANSINNATGAQKTWADQMVAGANVVMSLMSVLQAFSGIIDVATNPDMSGWEKFLSIGSSLAMMFVMLAPLLQGTNLQFLAMASTSIASALGIKTFSAAEVEAAISGNAAAAGTATFATALYTLLWPIGLVIAAIAALVLIVGGLNKLFKSFDEEEKLKKLEEETQKANEAFDRTKTKIEETKTALDSLDSGYETIEKLKEGTLEWYEAISNVNAEVMKMVETYPDLAQYISSDNGVLKISEAGQDYLSQEMERQYANAANYKMSTQIRTNNQKLEMGKSDYIDPTGGMLMIGADNYQKTTQLMQAAYEAPEIGETLFTQQGAQGLAYANNKDAIKYDVDYALGADYEKFNQEARDKFIDSLGTLDWSNTDAIEQAAKEAFGTTDFESVDFSQLSEELLEQRDNMKTLLDANEEHIKEQKILKDSNKRLQDAQFESVLSSMGSTRTADEGKELLNGRTYENIKAEQKVKLTGSVENGGFGNWNDHINYKDSDPEMDLIKDFMKQVGASDYVAQRGGNMVLKIEGEEKEFSKDEVINTLTDMHSTGAAQEEIKQALIPNIQEAYNIATEGLTAEQLVNLDELARGIKEGVSQGFEGSKEELNQKVNDMTQGIGKAYGSNTEALVADTSHINFDDVEIQRKIAGLTQQLNKGTISAEEFKVAIKEINAVGELDSLSSVFENAAEAMGGSKDEIAQNAAEMQNYAKQLMEVSKESDELSDELATNADSAADLAVEVTRMNKGVDKLADGIENWSSILKKSSKTSQEYGQALGEMRGALADVLDVNADLISNDFMTDPENLSLIEQAAKGSGEAIDALRAKMDEQLILNITAGQTDEFIAKVNKLDDVVQDLAANLPDIEVGAILKDEGFLEAANNLVEQSGMTADEANAYFAGIGYEPVYSTTDIENANSMQIPAGGTELSIDHIGWSDVPIDLPDWFPGDHKITLPKITYSGKPVAGTPVEAEADVRLTSFSGGTTPPKIKGMRKKASGGMNNYSKSNSGGKSPGSSGKKGGGDSNKPKKPTKAKTVEPTEAKNKDDEIERYKEITEILDDLNNELDEIGKLKDEAWGPDKLKAMDQEIAKLKQLSKAQQQYSDEIQSKLVGDKTAVAALGGTFDEFGRLTNYEELMGGLVDTWNSTQAALDTREQAYENSVAAVANTEYAEGQESQQWAAEDANDAEKEAIDKARDNANKAYEDNKKTIEQYMETLNLSEEAKRQLDDYLRQIKELNYEKLMYKIDFRVEVNERELKVLDHYIGRIEDDFYKTAEVMAKIYNDTGEAYKSQFYENDALQTLNTGINELEQAFKNGEITQADYIEGLGKIQDMAMDNVDALYEMNSQMREYYADVIDEGISKIQEMTNHFDHLTSKLQHYSSILSLMGHEQNYDLQNNLLQGQIDVLNDRIETSKATIAMLDDSLKSAQTNYEHATSEEDKEYWKERIIQINQALSEEEDAYLSYVEEVGDAANQILTNSIEKAFREAELSMTNDLGFDSILADMERMNTLTDEFLTNTNKMYETNKMISSAQLAIDKTQNAQAKQKYQDYIKYIEQLQVSGNLTQTELQTAQARYKVLEAEIALEEAKNAKSEVRLTRDSEGNFGYVYTANQDEVTSATQNYLDAQNELYNIGLENSKAYREKTIQLQQSTLEELKQLEIDFRIDHIISEEQYNQQKAAILETSNALLETYNEQFQVAQFTMATTSYNALMEEDTNFYNSQLSRNKEHTSLMLANDTEYYNGIKTTAAETQSTLETNLANFNAGVLSSENANYIVREARDRGYYNSLSGIAFATSKEIKGIFNDNNDSLSKALQVTFYNNLNTALNDCYSATSVWQGNMKPLLDTVGVSFNGKDIGLSAQIAATLKESQNLKDYITKKPDGLIDGIDKEWQEVETATMKWTEHWQNIQNNVIPAYDNLIQRTQLLIQAEAGPIANEPQYTTLQTFDGSSSNSDYSSGSNGIPEVGDIVTYIGGTYYHDSYGKSPSGSRGPGKQVEITQVITDGRPYPIHVKSNDSAYGWLREDQISGYDTGGYTGDWGPEGKLAVLHEKEIVLNAQDTENFLSAANILREVSQMLDNNALLASLGMINLSAMTVNTEADKVLQQDVTIHADFPNVTDHNEIEMAIDNLINAASQYANRK